MRKTVSGGGVVINSAGQVLVVSQHGNSWSLPKGHIDPGEDARAAAEREVKEESGISKLNYIRDLGKYERYMIGKNGGEDTTEWKLIIIFLYTTDQRELRPEDPDNPEARWVAPDEVADLLTHSKDKAFYESKLGEVKQFINNSPAHADA
jgi:ADP-ribose pyrophosphatase YjhB (NUDIX family)